MDVLTMYEVARQVQEQLDERVTYVHPVCRDVLGNERELDTKIESTKFALSFVREPVRDAGYRMQVFGPAVSEEDLQDCMLQVVDGAATLYVKKYPQRQAEDTQLWRLYLRQALIVRIGKMSRRKRVMKNGVTAYTKQEAYELSLDELLDLRENTWDGEHVYDRQVPEQFIVPIDMYREIEDKNFRDAFYATLPPRQQKIVDYLFGRVQGYHDFTNTKIAAMLGVCPTQFAREVKYIQSAYTHYAALD